jgi:hypothetical protein
MCHLKPETHPGSFIILLYSIIFTGPPKVKILTHRAIANLPHAPTHEAIASTRLLLVYD